MLFSRDDLSLEQVPSDEALASATQVRHSSGTNGNESEAQAAQKKRKKKIKSLRRD
jgi:hypothetical protein